MDGRSLTLSFLETMDVSTFKVDQITLQTSASAVYANGASLTAHTLTETAPPKPSADGLSVSVHLTDTDMNILTVKGVGRSTAAAWIVVTNLMISDMAAQPVLAKENSANALAVSTLVLDATDPELVSFALSMNLGTLTLVFDESVKVGLCRPEKLIIQSTISSDQANTALPITPVSTVTTTDGPSVTIAIGANDLNALKARTDLAISKQTAFLAILSEFITDMQGNNVVVIPTNAAKDADTYERDQTAPELVHFDLSFPAKRLTLVFSETVLASTVAVNTISFQSQEVADGSTDSFTLDTSTVVVPNSNPPPNAVTIEIEISSADLDKIKAKRALAISDGSTWITLTSVIADMGLSTDANTVKAITTAKAKSVRLYTEDQTKPQLASFKLDLDSHVLTLNFDETVDAASVKITEISLHNARPPSLTTSYTFDDGTPSVVDSTTITVALKVGDTNALKRDTALATSTADTWLTLSTDAVSDAYGLKIDPITSLAAVQADEFEEDKHNPVLDTFDFNVATGVLTMSFSETVEANSITQTEFTLQNWPMATCAEATAGTSVPLDLTNCQAADGTMTGVDTAADQTACEAVQLQADANLQACTYTSPTQSRGLTVDGSTIQTLDSHVIQMTLSIADMNEIKRLDSLCSVTPVTPTIYPSDCYLVATAAAVDDMNGNPLVWKMLPVSIYTQDSVDPTVSSFSLDLAAGTMTMVFDETVDVSSLVVGELTLFADNTGTGASVTLGTQSSSVSPDGTLVVIDISESDLNAIKLAETLGVIDENSVFLSASVDTIIDMNGRKVNVVAFKKASSLTHDNVAPTLRSFEVNMNSRTVSLSFSETMRANTLEATEFTLQSAITNVNANTKRAIASGIKSTANANTLSFVFSETDANDIKIKTALCTNDVDCKLLMSSLAVKDMNGNAITPVTNGAAIALISAAEYTADATSPVLEQFDLDMDTLKPPVKLTMTFSETVLLSSLNLGGITLTDKLGASVPLTDGVKSQDASSPTIVKVELDAVDLASIRATESVGRTVALTNIVLSSTAITDHKNNAVEPIDSTTPELVVTTHTVDVTPPSITAFAIDFGLNTITLTFSEVVVQSTLIDTRIGVQSDQVAVTGTETFFLSGSTSITSPFAGVYVFAMKKVDVDALKANTALAAGAASTWLIVDANIGQDFAENKAYGVDASAALECLDYKYDEISPNLIEFEFDINDGVITLSFDEVVSASSVTAGGMVFASSLSNAAESSPALAGTASLVDGTSITLTLTLDSANEVRALTGLATSDQNTFLTVDASAFTDSNSNDATPVTIKVNAGTGFVADTTEPLAEKFKLDLTTGKMMVKYEQPVNGASVDPTTFTLQNAANGPTDTFSEYTLTAAGTTTSQLVDSWFTLTLSTNDLNEIKLRTLCDNVNQESSCFLRFGADSVIDATGLSIVSIADTTTNALPCIDYTEDVTDPKLITAGFRQLDLNNGEITFSFTEAMNRNSIVPSKISLVETPVSIPGATSQLLTGATVVSSRDNTELTFKLSTDVLDAVKSSLSLCTKISQCYIVMETGALYGAHFQTEIYTQGCHWIPRMFA
jgi:hypothetical protein